MTGENRERRWDATVGERANGCAVDAGVSGDCGRCGGRCGDGWRAVVVMEDDTLASGCAGGAGGGGSTGDGGSVDGRYDACSALHEHVDGVDLCAGSDGDGGDDGWW